MEKETQEEVDVEIEQEHQADPEVVEAPSPIPPAADVRSELEEYVAISHQRRRLLPRAALVGLIAGLVGAIFRLVLGQADAVRLALLTWALRYPVFGWVFPILFGAAGALASVALVRHYAPETSGSGIPHLKAVLHRFRDLKWQRVLPVKFIAGALALGSGLALGREGPTVQIGGAVGQAVGQWLKAPPREQRTLIAAGAGAGLAAAFNAPLSGLTFVLEEVQRDFHPIVFAASFLAAVIADIVARVVAGDSTVFSIPSYPAPPMDALPYFIILGILAGVLGVAFNRGLIAGLDFFLRWKGRSGLIAAAIMGAVVGLVAWFSPAAVGSGHGLAESILYGQMALSAIPLFFLLRFFLTLGSYSSGAAGGIFAPLLVLGALLGLGVGLVVHDFAPQAAPTPAVFAVVGMAAYFTAIVRAPLTGILLIVEMTGSYEQMLPLLVACFCAYATAELMQDLPIYEALLERDLRMNDAHIALDKPMVVEFEIESGAPFEGHEVRNLGLPPGCVLVRVVEGGQEFVPMASTRLESNMKITAVIAPQASEGLTLLHIGCKSHME